MGLDWMDWPDPGTDLLLEHRLAVLINLLTHLTDQGCRSVVEPCSSLQRQLSWSLWLRLLKPVPGKCRDMSKTFSKIGVPAASLASCCHLGGEAGSDEAVKKARMEEKQEVTKQ